MKFNVVQLSNYRGIAREIDITCFKMADKKSLDIVIEKYLNYIDVTLNFQDEELFKYLLDYYRFLKTHNITCEIIAYDNIPIDEAFGYEIEFLGLDVTHDMCESLIEEYNENIASFTNENGLCYDMCAVKKVISISNNGNLTWEPCYVYKVKVD